MAQMAPALVETAGSPSPNTDISSSTVADPLRLSNVEEAIKQENSRLHVNSASLNHNGICRSLANSKTTTKPVSCIMERVHMLNKFPYARQKSLGSTVCPKPNTQLQCPPSSVEKTAERDKIHSQSSPKEALVSTPTRIPPKTTTKTCAANSQQNLSSCDDSVDNTNSEIKQRHSVARPEASPQALFDKRVSKIACNQNRLAARARKLERRLRTLQKRQLESHVSEQLTISSVRRRNRQTTRSDNCVEKPNLKLQPNTGHGPSSHIVKEEKSKEKRQHNFLVQENKLDARKTLKDDSKLNGQIKGSLEKESKPRLTAPGFGEGESTGDVARSLVCQLELLEDVGDSDATQSSSGGESCDEMDEDNLNLDTTRPNYLNKFHSDRGSIASRWAWLRSQVVDVERRIRRCEETYKSIRLRKGSIQLGKQKVVVERRTVVSVANKSAEDLLVDTVNILNSLKEPHNLNNSIRTGSQRPEVSISRNSNCLLTEEHKEKTNSIINNGKNNVHLTDHIYSCTAARTRPVQYWQKRKLFSLPQLQKPNQNVLCACSSPLTPCVLCQRNSKNLPVLKPKQSIKERVSLLDSSFHPVLSFDTEIPLSLHFGALLKKGKFQSKICKLSPPKVTKIPAKRKYVRSVSSPAAVKKERKESSDLPYRKQGIRTLRKRKKSVSLPNTPKTQNSTQRLCKTEVANKKRPAAVNAGIRLASQLQKRARSLSLPSANSRPSSPVLSGVSPTSLGYCFPGGALSAKRKKLTSNAFDINNIVIPYSMASTTRVEKLKYKEIMTPAWRELVVTNQENTKPDAKDGEDNGEDEEIEDLSALTFALRHMKCEEQERKRFLGMAIKKKKRATRQNSETTTPEPVSPGSLLIDGSLSTGQTSSGIPSPCSTNPPSLNSSLNVTSPTGLAGLPLVNMLPPDSLLAKLDHSGKTARHDSRRTLSIDQSEDSNDDWPVVIPWLLREFPLSENDLKVLTETPPIPYCPTSAPLSPSSSTSRSGSPILSHVDSPDNATNANWTVKVLSPEIEDNLESDSKPPRKGIVLKLAKR